MSNDKRRLLCTVLARFFPIVFLAPVGAAYADAPTSSDARRLVELLRYQDQLDVAKRVCKDAKTTSPEVVQKESPDYFDNLTPGDRRWPLVVKAYSDYLQTICTRPTVEESLGLMAETYAAKLSKEDLRVATAFYSSPAGQKLVPAHKAASSALFSATQAAQAEVTPRAIADFRQRIREISRQSGTDEADDAGPWVRLRSAVTHSYYASEMLLIAGLFALAWRQRNIGLLVAAIAFGAFLFGSVEISRVNESLTEVRNRGGDLTPYEDARETWKFVSAIGFLTGALSVIAATFRFSSVKSRT